MSTHPRVEARVSALEHRQTNLEAHTEELIEELTNDLTASVKRLYDDMTASFKQLTAYHIQTEQQIDARFNKIETTMATKEDLAAMENRILDTFKQLLTTINPQNPPAE